MRFTIECDGLTHKEGQRIIEYLLGISELKDVHMRFTMSASAESSVMAAISHFAIWATASGTAGAAFSAGKTITDAALKEIGEKIGKRLGAWASDKLTGKHASEVSIKLYGPDDKLIEDFARKR